MKNFNQLAYANANELIFGTALYPVKTKKGVEIGGGTVYPELNFTLPSIEIVDANFDKIKAIYGSIITDAADRALALESPGFVVEFETLIEMTLKPEYAIEITKVIAGILDDYHTRHGLKTALRITPNDTRDKNRPPIMRSGELLDNLLTAFEGCAAAGAELLSIESTGGKEVHDDALLMCDLEQTIFALAILGARDMKFLWQRIKRIADTTNTQAAGDTACGFGNTAMVLAEKNYIPRVFSALVRAGTIVRSLVAYEQGAIGPGKDCGYENPFIKAITGYPMSMEGKSACCAHSSPVGNIASATCDLWSNESVQNVKLLGGMAPTISMEQLIYDCRLMNQASEHGHAHVLQNLMITSDARLDAQALILTPENVIRISNAIVNETGYYRRTVASISTALELIQEAHSNGQLKIRNQEAPWIERFAASLAGLPADEDKFIEQVLPTLDTTRFIPAEYGL